MWNASILASPLQRPIAVQTIVLGQLLMRYNFVDFLIKKPDKFVLDALPDSWIARTLQAHSVQTQALRSYFSTCPKIRKSLNVSSGKKRSIQTLWLLYRWVNLYSSDALGMVPTANGEWLPLMKSNIVTRNEWTAMTLVNAQYSSP